MREKNGAGSLFTSVALVLKHSSLAKLSLEVAAASVNAFVDCSSLYQTLESASEAGCVRLLARLGPREWSGLSDRFRDQRRLNGIIIAARTGRLDVLQWWLFSYIPNAELDDTLAKLLFELSVKKGQLQTLQWLKAHGHFPLASYREKPLKCGHPQVIEWLVNEKCPVPIQLCMAASAKIGDWAFAKWVHEQGELMLGPAKRWFLVGHHAARLGSLEMVQWMYVNRPKDFTEMTLRGAIEGGHLEIAQWANDHGLKNQFRILCPPHLAAIDLPMAQWLWSEIREVDMLTADPWILNLLLNAARHDRLDIIEWLHAHGVPTRPGIVAVAIWKGDMEMMQRLLTIRPEENVRDNLKCAASHGQLEMFKWFHSQQSNAVDSYVMLDAISKGHLHIAKYIYAHCDRFKWHSGNMEQAAAINGQLQTLLWLHANGKKRTVDLGAVASRGHLQVLKYLLLNGNTSYSPNTAVEAAKRGQFSVLAWLMQYDPAIAHGELVHATLASFTS